MINKNETLGLWSEVSFSTLSSIRGFVLTKSVFAMTSSDAQVFTLDDVQLDDQTKVLASVKRVLAAAIRLADSGYWLQIFFEQTYEGKIAPELFNDTLPGTRKLIRRFGVGTVYDLLMQIKTEAGNGLDDEVAVRPIDRKRAAAFISACLRMSYQQLNRWKRVSLEAKAIGELIRCEKPSEGLVITDLQQRIAKRTGAEVRLQALRKAMENSLVLLVEGSSMGKSTTVVKLSADPATICFGF